MHVTETPGQVLLVQRAHLVLGQHHRHVPRALGAHHAIEPGKFDFQHFPIKEQQRRQRLVLRRSRHTAGHRELRQKRFHLRPAHLARVALAVKENEPADPVQVRILRPQAVVLHADPFANLVEQFWGCHAVTPGGCLYWTNAKVPVTVDAIEDSRSCAYSGQTRTL